VTFDRFEMLLHLLFRSSNLLLLQVHRAIGSRCVLLSMQLQIDLRDGCSCRIFAIAIRIQIHGKIHGVFEIRDRGAPFWT
jgi:hypothetical protein